MGASRAGVGGLSATNVGRLEGTLRFANPSRLSSFFPLRMELFCWAICAPYRPYKPGAFVLGKDLPRLGCISLILPFQYSTYFW